MTTPTPHTEWGILGPGMTTPLTMPHWTYDDALHYAPTPNHIVRRTVTDWHTP